jgi:hypothetical protein
MPRPLPHDGLDRFQRYRCRRLSRGLKLVRIWLPDPAAAGFAEEARRQAAILRDAPEETEALEFIAHAAEVGDHSG